MTESESFTIIKALVMAITGKLLSDEEIRAYIVGVQKPASNSDYTAAHE